MSGGEGGEEGNEDPIGWGPLKSGECDRKAATAAASEIKAASDNIAAAESAYHTRRSQSSN